MPTLPNGQKTNNDQKYVREWTKIAAVVGKSLGMSVGNVWGEITFNSEIMRSNGKKAVVSTTTLPHFMVVRLYNSLMRLQFQNKQLLNTAKKLHGRLQEMRQARQQAQRRG